MLVEITGIDWLVEEREKVLALADYHWKNYRKEKLVEAQKVQSIIKSKSFNYLKEDKIYQIQIKTLEEFTLFLNQIFKEHSIVCDFRYRSYNQSFFLMVRESKLSD